MTKRKLKPWVLPTVYVLIITSLFLSLFMIGRTINSGIIEQDLDHVTDVILENDLPVNQEIEQTTTIIKPYIGENISLTKNFYDKDAEEKTQQNSLIYYENIYMQNTGVLYSSEAQFDIVAVLDGEVKNVKKDNILGNVIEIEHSTNLTAFYQSVDEVKVKTGDVIKQGDVIAKSGANSIKDTKDNCLHFQVYYKGELLNPETFYNMNLNELS